MSSELLQRIEEISQRATACAPDDRAAFLDQACLDDEPLRRAVTAILADNQQTLPLMAEMAETRFLTNAADRWRRIEPIFQAALDLVPDERAAFLDRACAGDETLRREVESLIAYQEPGREFIEGVVGAAD